MHTHMRHMRICVIGKKMKKESLYTKKKRFSFRIWNVSIRMKKTMTFHMRS